MEVLLLFLMILGGFYVLLLVFFYFMGLVYLLVIALLYLWPLIFGFVSAYILNEHGHSTASNVVSLIGIISTVLWIRHDRVLRIKDTLDDFILRLGR
jgi:hypothetical protein